MSELPNGIEAERIAKIRARLVEIENSLFSRAAYAPSAILSRIDPDALVAGEEYRAALRVERASLLAQLPATGEAAGHLVLARTLGTVYVREATTDAPEDDGEDASNPYLRFAKECGEKIR
jgi:hypothetical protein